MLSIFLAYLSLGFDTYHQITIVCQENILPVKSELLIKALMGVSDSDKAVRMIFEP